MQFHRESSLEHLLIERVDLIIRVETIETEQNRQQIDALVSQIEDTI